MIVFLFSQLLDSTVDKYMCRFKHNKYFIQRTICRCFWNCCMRVIQGYVFCGCNRTHYSFYFTKCFSFQGIWYRNVQVLRAQISQNEYLDFILPWYSLFLQYNTSSSTDNCWCIQNCFNYYSWKLDISDAYA